MDATLKLEIPGKRSRPFDVGNFALRRGPWIIAIGLVLFVCLSPAAFVLSKPYYRSSGRLLLTQKVKMFLDRHEEMIQGDFRDFAATYGERLVGNAVTKSALAGLPREQWPEFVRGIPTEEAAARVLSKRIVVIPMGRSYLMEVAMTAGSPEGMAETVNAVMTSFLELLESEQAWDSDRRLAYLEKELAQLRVDLVKREDERQTVSAELGHSSFSEERNPFYELLIAVQSEHERARTAAMEQQALLEKARREQSILGNQDLEVYAEEAVSNNEALYMIDNWTYQKLQDLRAGIDGLTEANSERIYVEQRMQAMNEYLEKFKKELHESALTILEKKRAQELSEVVTKSQSTAEAGTDFEENLRRQLDATREAFAKSSILVNRGKELNAEMADIKDRISRVEDRIREVQLEAKMPVHVGIDQMAESPAGPEGDNFGKLIAMIFMGAFGVIGVAFTAYELFDGRIRAPGDIRAALGALPADPIPSFGASGKLEDFASCVRDFPAHPCAVAIRGLAFRIERERARSLARVFLVCGGESGSGVSWLTANLADAMTQYLERVLVIRLDQEELPAIAPGGAQGFSFDRYFDEAWMRISQSQDAVTHLHIGSDTPLMRRRDWLRDFVKRISTSYDIVLLDTRPVIASDLTRFIAGYCEVVIVVARESITHFGPFRKSIELFVRLGVPAITAVLVGRTDQPLDRFAAFGPWLIEKGLPQVGVLFVEKMQHHLMGLRGKIAPGYKGFTKH